DATPEVSQHALDLRRRRKNRRHPSVVRKREAGHGTAASAYREQRILEGESTCRYERSVFAQAVAHYEIGCDTIACEKARERDVRRQHGWLRDFCSPESLLGLGDGASIGRIDEDELGKRASEE